MNFSSRLIAFSFIALTSIVSTMACEEYDPPPEVDLVRSGAGAYNPGDALPMTFSSSIDPETFEVTLWPSSRGTRRVADEDVEPIAGPCRADGDDCSEVTIDLSSDADGAEISFEEPLGGIGSNFILEVLPGLSDQEGNATGASRFFSIRYRGATDPDPDANIDFDEGVFIFGGSVNNPVPAVLTLVANVRVLPDGRLAVAGAEGDVDDSEEDISPTSRDPRYIIVDDTENGWAIFFTGLIVENAEDRLFLETEVFDVTIPVLGTILQLQEVRLFAEILKDDDDYDLIDGTLTYERVILGDDEYEGDSTSLIGEFVPDEFIPDGAPEICDEPCGGVTGQCEPPQDFPDPDFCVEEE